MLYQDTKQVVREDLPDYLNLLLSTPFLFQQVILLHPEKHEIMYLQKNIVQMF